MTSTELKPLSQQDLAVLSMRFKQALRAIYGATLDRLVLFGSYARGDFRPDSDIDFLVVLNQDVVAFGQEVDRISAITSELGLDYTVHISAKPVPAMAYRSSDRLFFQAVRNEGIAI